MDKVYPGAVFREKLKTPLYPGNKTGGILKMDFMIHPFNLQNNLGLYLQAGYKTLGYTIGEPLAETFILHYGISLHL